MTWQKELINFYEVNKEHAGDFSFEGYNGNAPLACIFHKNGLSTIEVSLNSSGRFITGNYSEKIIEYPITSKSMQRTNGAAKMPHGLFEQLIFFVQNVNYFPVKEKTGKNKEKIIIPSSEDYYNSYTEALKLWAEDKEYSHPYIKAIYDYVTQNDIAADLIAAGVISLDAHGLITEKLSKEMIRFRVDGKNTWEDRNLHQAWIDYYTKRILTKDNRTIFCPVSGEEQPAVIGFMGLEGTGHKLFSVPSGNSSTVFTASGERFKTNDEAIMMGAYTEQKISAALQWLKKYENGHSYGNISSFLYLIWGYDDLAAKPWLDSNQVMPQQDEDDEEDERAERKREIKKSKFNSMEDWAIAFKKYLAGFQAKIDLSKPVNLIAIKSMTTGRSSICYQYSIPNNDFYKIIRDWHVRGAWKQCLFGKEFYGIPSPKMLVKACYTMHTSQNKLDLVERQLINRMITNQRVPYNLVKTAARNVAHKMSCIPRKDDLQASSVWAWTYNCLNPVCSLIAEYYNFTKNDEGDYYTMALDKESTDRSYLYGRLLAVANKLESDAQKTARTTNAMKLAAKFQDHPAFVWNMIMKRLLPYINAKKDTRYMERQIQDITNMFDPKDYISKDKLTPMFWLGYSAQTKDLYTSHKNDAAENPTAIPLETLAEELSELFPKEAM